MVPIASVSAIVRNLRPLEGRAYIGLIDLAILMNAKWVSPGEAVTTFAAGVPFLWYTFSINNCFDVDTDSLNPNKVKKNPLASEELNFANGIALSIVLALLGVLIAFKTNPTVFAIYLAMTALAALYFALELRNHLGDYESDLRAGLTPLGALGAVAVGLRVNYRALDALVLALLVAHTRVMLSG